MPPEDHTPIRRIRVSDERWDALERSVGARGRSALINAFIAWHLREPKARRPKQRPPDTDTPAE